VSKVDTGASLVAKAGTTMNDIVSSVQRVTDIMGEILAASQEQTAGISEINTAVSQMDQVTQQNAALVEQAAAASESMQHQAAQLAQVVSIFKVGTAPAASALAAQAQRAQRHVPVRNDAGSRNAVVAPRSRAIRREQIPASKPAEEWREF
jgi:methyl-accepting chemotaxis protein